VCDNDGGVSFPTEEDVGGDADLDGVVASSSKAKIMLVSSFFVEPLLPVRELGNPVIEDSDEVLGW
jgi:hypothetical protein